MARKKNWARKSRARKLDLRSLGARSQRSYDRATQDVPRYMAEGASFTEASRLAGVDRRTARKYLGPSIRKSRGGRRIEYKAGYANQRLMNVITNIGVVQVQVSRAADRKLIGAHANAVGRFLGSERGSFQQAQAIHDIERFRGASVEGYELETDLDTIEALGAAGMISVDQVYVELSKR